MRLITCDGAISLCMQTPRELLLFHSNARKTGPEFPYKLCGLNWPSSQLYPSYSVLNLTATVDIKC